MEISGIISVVGGLSVLLGVFDFFSDEDDWKQATKKVVGGIIILCLGVALNKFFGL